MSKPALSVDRLVRVSVNLQPLAPARRNFGVLCIAGSSPVIDAGERLRFYTGLEAIAQDFGVNAPEYLAAQLFFAQSPKPAQATIGRFVKEDSPALLKGGNPAEADHEALAWTGITDGGFGLTVNSAGVSVTGLDFSAVTNLNGVASIITAKLAQDGVNCVWDGTRFILTTLGSGANQEIGYAVPAQNGTDISGKLALAENQALPPLPGLDAESPLDCVLALADAGDWYGLTFCADLSLEDHLAVSAQIEAMTKARIYLVTVSGSRILSPAVTDDLPSRLKALNRKRTFTQYSANPHAACSAAGRAFSVNFSANRSAITLKFKQEPGIVPEGLKESEAQSLAAKNCNVFASYDNDTAILQEGVMASGAFFDEIHGLDWLQNAIQTSCHNLLYQSKTKLPQTDAGVNQLVTAIGQALDEGVKNGLIAPGVWRADPIGELEQGDYLPAGWHIHAQSVDEQPQTEREQRKAPPIQAAVKLAGAIHSVDVAIDVNR